MKLKEKIIGLVGVLVLSVVFLVGGYFVNKRNEEAYKSIYTNNSNDSIFLEDNSSKKASQENNEKAPQDKTEALKEVATNKKIIVDIKGAVKDPKEYELLEGARVRDLINKAGGITEEADENLIHFSKVLRDQECIIVYKIGEAPKNDIANIANQSSGSAVKSEKINLNSATMEQLLTLYGIGEVKAKSIIEYREKSGGFKSIEELSNIDGIGSKTLDKLRDKVDIK